MATKYSFEDYRKIFTGAVAKYEGLPFFVKLLQTRTRPAFPAAPREAIIFGIRHDAADVDHREDHADDIISIVRVDSDGLPMVREYAGTTESGDFDKVENPLGDFKMLPGFYYFRFGKHHGTNDCLVQDHVVYGERALKHKDFNETDDKTWEIDDTSIHIHAGIQNVNHVGNWSAGCTVVAGGWEGAAWKEFFKYCNMATNRPLAYVLVNESDIAQFLAQ